MINSLPSGRKLININVPSDTRRSILACAHSIKPLIKENHCEDRYVSKVLSLLNGLEIAIKQRKFHL